jgi:hypothetical protein
MGTRRPASQACNPVCARGSSSCPVAAAVLSSVQPRDWSEVLGWRTGNPSARWLHGVSAECVCVRKEGKDMERTPEVKMSHAVGLESRARGSWRLEPVDGGVRDCCRPGPAWPARGGRGTHASFSIWTKRWWFAYGNVRGCCSHGRSKWGLID